VLLRTAREGEWPRPARGWLLLMHPAITKKVYRPVRNCADGRSGTTGVEARLGMGARAMRTVEPVGLPNFEVPSPDDKEATLFLKAV